MLWRVRIRPSQSNLKNRLFLERSIRSVKISDIYKLYKFLFENPTRGNWNNSEKYVYGLHETVETQIVQWMGYKRYCASYNSWVNANTKFIHWVRQEELRRLLTVLYWARWRVWQIMIRILFQPCKSVRSEQVVASVHQDELSSVRARGN